MLSKKQKQVYEWLRRFIARKGYAPSYEEIREGLGLNSLNTVSYHLHQLSAKGYLRSSWGNQKRALELLNQPPVLLLLGEVQAGFPVESYEAPEPMELPSGIFDPENHFALRVRGESMAGEGILDRDVIVVRKQDAAENGEVVVALVEGEATVKRYRRSGARIELIPANPAYKTIVAGEEQVRIMGIVVALFRGY